MASTSIINSHHFSSSSQNPGYSAVMIARLRAEHVGMHPLWLLNRLSILHKLCQSTSRPLQRTTRWQYGEVLMQLMLAMVLSKSCTVCMRMNVQWSGARPHSGVFVCHAGVLCVVLWIRAYQSAFHASFNKLSPANSNSCETPTMCMQHPRAYISVYLSNRLLPSVYAHATIGHTTIYKN